MFRDTHDREYYKAKSAALESMVTTLFRNVKSQINGSPYAHSRKDGSFFFIPLGVQSSFGVLYSLLTQELEGRPVESFLDAGSGLGNIVTMAFHIGLARNCHGLEYDKRYVGFSKHFMVHDSSYPSCNNGLRNGKIEYIQGDIFTFEDYSKYDVIYYFCPFADRGLEKMFEELVEDQMKVGAYLVACNKQGWDIRKDKRFEPVEKVCGTIWKKISDGPRKVSLLNCESSDNLKARWSERYPHLAERQPL